MRYISGVESFLLCLHNFLVDFEQLTARGGYHLYFTKRLDGGVGLKNPLWRAIGG